MNLTSRSAALEYQRCPRARYAQYMWGGHGVVPARAQVELVTGSAAHAGVGGLLNGATVDDAVGLAHAEFDRELAGQPLAGCEGEWWEYTVAEQKALAEGLTRLYAARALDRLLAEFEVESVEREIVMPLTPELGWQARADAGLRRRADRDPYVYSLKTANQWSDRKDEENRLDMQGVSELASVEHLTGERVMGVKMEFLIKGRRDRTKGDDGVWRTLQDSALVRPWRSMGPFETRWAWQGLYPCADPATCKYHSKRPSANPHHSLSSKDGWERVPVWEHMPMREWVRMLTSGEVQPEAGDPCDQWIVSPVPYYRNQDDVRRWRRQVTAQEARVFQGADACNSILTGGPGNLEEACDVWFPQYKRSCVWPTACQYYDHDTTACTLVGETLEDPVGAGLVRRRPHHLAEREALDAQ